MTRIDINHPGADTLSKAVALEFEKRREITSATNDLAVGDCLEIFGFGSKEGLRKYVGIRLVLSDILDHVYEHVADEKKLSYTLRRVR